MNKDIQVLTSKSNWNAAWGASVVEGRQLLGANGKVLDCILVDGEGFLKEVTSKHQHDESGGHSLGRRKCVYKAACAKEVLG